tara:strand:+ start:300 stop:512 length:213 start_codon:yes stop_codon:yes gene_type:complete
MGGISPERNRAATWSHIAEFAVRVSLVITEAKLRPAVFSWSLWQVMQYSVRKGRTVSSKLAVLSDVGLAV